jgi:hypothetical protein
MPIDAAWRNARAGRGPAIGAVPLQLLAYPGMLIEIEGIAMA